MKIRFKNFLWIAAILVLLLEVSYVIFNKKRDNFKLEYLTANLAFHPAWEVQHSLDDEVLLKSMLNQPFFYLGKGGKSYAFESRDGLYVLKFFKFKYLRTNLLNKILSLIPYFEDRNIDEMQRRHRKFYGVFQGYKWAYDLNKKNSGLVYLHLNPSFNQFGFVTLNDKLGFKHRVDLDQCAFIFQEKCCILSDLLSKALGENDNEKAHMYLSKITDMFINQYENGLYDRDYGILHNTGFVGTRPVHFDMGKMTFDESMKQVSSYKPHLITVMTKIERWIKHRYPQHYPVVVKGLEDRLSMIFGERFKFDDSM